MDKLETIKVIAVRLLDLKKLKKDTCSVAERLKSEGLTISGTHVIEALTVSINTVEKVLLSLLQTLIPPKATISRIATADLMVGFIGIVEGEEVNRALVIATGEIKDLIDLDPIIELND
jgi:hypothetical protein